MNQNFKTLFLCLIAPLLTLGCSTTSVLFDRPKASMERTKRLVEMAQHYEQSGKSQAAMRIYEHLLIRQPDNETAKARRDSLAQHEKLGQSYVQSSPQRHPGLTPTAQADSGSVLPTLAIKSPDNMTAGFPVRSLEQELQLADKLRPTGTEILVQSLSSESATGQQQPSRQLPSLIMASHASEQQADKDVDDLPAAPADAEIAQTCQGQAQKGDLDCTSWQRPHCGEDVTKDWRPTYARSSETLWHQTDILLQESESSLTREHAQPMLSLIELCENLPRELLPLIARMEGPHPEGRISALLELQNESLNGKSAITAVYALLQDEDELVRVYAARSLCEMSNDRSSSVQTLRQALNSQNEDVVCLAAFFLGQMDSDAIGAIDALTLIRDQRHGACRLYAAEAMSQIASEDSQSIEIIASELESDNRQMRWLAALMLGTVKVNHELEAVEALRKAILDSDPTISSIVCLSLAGMNTHGHIATTELRRATHSVHPDVKFAAELALNCLKNEIAVLQENSLTKQ